MRSYLTEASHLHTSTTVAVQTGEEQIDPKVAEYG